MNQPVSRPVNGEQELRDLIWRWEQLSTDRTLPAATRRALEVCLEDLNDTLDRIAAGTTSARAVPGERPSGEHE